MNLEPKNLDIPLQSRSRFALWLGLGAVLAVVVGYLLDPALGKAMFATALLVLPALVVGRAVPLRRGSPLGLNSVGTTLVVALILGYLLVAKRWLLPWLLSSLG